MNDLILMIKKGAHIHSMNWCQVMEVTDNLFRECFENGQVSECWIFYTAKLHFYCALTLGEPTTNRESNPKDHSLSAGFPISSPFIISKGY